jgi:uncharacterized protein
MSGRTRGHMLRPVRIVASVSDIPLAQLKEDGVRALILDLDNTLVGWRQPEPPPAVEAWVRDALSAGYALAIVSNNERAWVRAVSTSLGIVTFVHRAFKPIPFGMLRALRQLRVAKAQTLVIGDQLFTDVLAASLLGMRAVLVSPIVAREHWVMSAVRRIERLLVVGPPESIVPDGSHGDRGPV